MQLLILFETGEGHTRKIVDFVAEQTRDKGHNVTVVDTSDTTAKLALETVDKVICAAPVHERRHPQTFEATLNAAKKDLAKLPVLIISVSLKAAFQEGMDEAQDYVTELEMRTGFKATRNACVAGAVKPGSYDYFQSQIVQHVALAGHDVVLRDGEQEFTDWVALSDILGSFLNS